MSLISVLLNKYPHAFSFLDGLRHVMQGIEVLDFQEINEIILKPDSRCLCFLLIIILLSDLEVS